VLELKERFNKVYLMLDNDAPGQKMVDKYMNLYPFLIPKFMPKELGKDKTDVCKKIGFEETEKLIKQLLDG
jgi:DNA primase